MRDTTLLLINLDSSKLIDRLIKNVRILLCSDIRFTAD